MTLEISAFQEPNSFGLHSRLLILLYRYRGIVAKRGNHTKKCSHCALLESSIEFSFSQGGDPHWQSALWGPWASQVAVSFNSRLHIHLQDYRACYSFCQHLCHDQI